MSWNGTPLPWDLYCEPCEASYIPVAVVGKEDTGYTWVIGAETPDGGHPEADGVLINTAVRAAYKASPEEPIEAARRIHALAELYTDVISILEGCENHLYAAAVLLGDIDPADGSDELCRIKAREARQVIRRLRETQVAKESGV